MALLQRFILFIQEQNLFQKNDHLLLTVSGGVDSVVLCELCKQAGFHFTIAHCNFQLRGEESERDERFVRSLGDKYGVKVLVNKFETKKIASEQKSSIQETARILRYTWFFNLWKESKESVEMNPVSENTLSGWHVTGHSRHFVLTAHHANDNIETMVMNFFKGTGIKGMHGILPKSGVANYMVRPLLFATKEELLLFSKENNLAYVEDSSNSSDKYTRNYFRNQLIPALKKVYPEVEDNLKRNIERFREIEILYDQAIKLHKQKLIEIKGDEVHIPILKLLKVNPLKTILYEIIKEYGFTPHQTDEVINILQRESGKYVSSSSHKIIKNRAWLIIAPINTLLANHILINENEKEINFEGGKIRIREQPITDYERLGTDKVMLDAEAIIFPLLLRKWKQGDYFYPLGMKGKKKLSKFFIDQKISLTDKERIWVIENNKKIIWIVGKRIDDRFKITDKTKKILSIELIK